ncbi:thioester domain-containing protein [Saccharothrix obliqua]|uniref:thioester domain-containing protein n=1 Tax=Saccharothrix obliqua TaxID=2861747 RepID=UPI001C5DD987|nr:thioester domain-containing protein [Saccharothrix obliqua]MBW4719690.1 thioester domain-containing protein [Saccharothrix obliqua]
MGAAVLGASLVLLSALPAAADAVEIKPFPGADQPGMGVYLLDKDGKPVKNGKPVHTELIGVKFKDGNDSQTATAYCVELPTPLEDNTSLKEAPWGEHPNPESQFPQNAKYVNWILHHSYPKLDEKDAKEFVGLPNAGRSSLIAATQAAIWHYTDGVTLRENDSTGDKSDEVDADVLAIYKKLTGPDNVGEDAAPAPTLEVTPKSQEGKAGSLIGPFTITTSSGRVLIEAEVPAGVTFTDKDGKELTVAKGSEARAASADLNISEVFVKVADDAAPGEVEFTVHASSQLNSGRLFIASDSRQKTQSLVIATSNPMDAKDQAKAKWTADKVETTTSAAPTTETSPEATTAAPTTTTTTPAVVPVANEDELASTGASIFVPLLIGLGLLGAGAAALIIVRRKKTTA